jgi:hypothetical protein
MKRKGKDSAAKKVESNTVCSENTEIKAQTGAAANRPIIAEIRRGPGGKADWLVSILGVCTDAPIRDRRLVSYRKYRNVIKFRFGVHFDPMPQAVWLASVVAAITKGGAS